MMYTRTVVLLLALTPFHLPSPAFSDTVNYLVNDHWPLFEAAPSTPILDNASNTFIHQIQHHGTFILHDPKTVPGSDTQVILIEHQASAGHQETNKKTALDSVVIRIEPRAAFVQPEPHVKAAFDAAFSVSKQLEADESPGAAISYLQDQLPELPGEAQGMALRSMAYAKLRAGDRAGARADFARITRGEVPSTEEHYLDARMRLGYLMLGDGDRKGALEQFQNVASGMTKADRMTATEAGTRVGAILRLEGRAEEAISAFQQVADQTPSVEDMLYAKLQISGLLWESAKGDYGTPNEDQFRQSSEVALEIINHPDVIPKTLAIAELIHLENFYFLGDFETAITMAEAYIEKWMQFHLDNPAASSRDWDAARQIVTAQTWLAFCLYRTGRYEDCIRVCRLIRSGTWDEDTPYRNFNVFGYSLIYEAFSHEAMGDYDTGRNLRAEARRKYTRWYDSVIRHVEIKVGIRDAPEGATQ